MATKEDVRQRLDIAEIIGEYVQLQPAGKGRLKGLCPFHQEKTPSFQVDTEQGYYHCFGCKASGDVFSFVQQINGLHFQDALEQLAHRVGLTIERKYGEKKSRDLYEINEFALAYFRRNMNATIQDYLIGRGLQSEIIDQFEIGYAPNQWDALLKEAKSNGISEKLLTDAGLVINQNTRLYDRFRHRIIFPIRDHLGRLVGFGGRVLDDSKPKYLNTPETAIFKKGELLYGLYEARKHLKQFDYEIVAVEGYLDVMMMHQHGFYQTVASLGTALTTEHSLLLQRLGVHRLTLMFDRDQAGLKATLGGLDQTLGAHLRVKATSIASGKDPAEVLLSGTHAITEALQGGLDEAEYRVQAALERHGNTTEGKRQILLELAPRMQNLDPLDTEAKHLRQLASEALQLEEKALYDWISNRSARKSLTPVHISGMQLGRHTEAELQLLRAVLVDPQLADKIDDDLSWQNAQVKSLLQALRQAPLSEVLLHFRGQPEEPLLIRLLFESQESGTIARAHIRQFQDRKAGYAAQAVEHLQRTLSIDMMRTELEQLKKELLQAEPSQQVIILQHIGNLTKAIEAEKRSRSSVTLNS